MKMFAIVLLAVIGLSAQNCPNRRRYDCRKNPRGDLYSCVSFCEETSQIIMETSRATQRVIMTQGRVILHPDDQRPTVLPCQSKYVSCSLVR